MSRNVMYFAGVAVLFLLTGLMLSWNQSLFILNFALVSAIMALGVNMQWGYAGLFNTGVMGFAALGGLAVALISADPVPEAWAAGGAGVLGGLILGAVTIAAAIFTWRRMAPGRARGLAVLAVLVGGFVLFRAVFGPATMAVEAVNPSVSGNLGGLGLPVLLAWPAGGLLAALAAWAIGKTALGLRSDYLAIATLGIAEIIIAVMKNEDWMARGVKMMNLQERPWPVPYGGAAAEPRFPESGRQHGLRSGHRIVDPGEAVLHRDDPDRAGRHHLAVAARPQQPLGPDDARDPR